MTNENPHRGQNAAGVKADELQQSTASLLSFQRIARAIAAVGESTAPLDAALAYAKEEWPGFHCSPADKGRSHDAASRTQPRNSDKSAIGGTDGRRRAAFPDLDFDTYVGARAFADCAQAGTLRIVSPEGGRA
jgi:hypothetical protein